jgi:Acyl-CoA carboxylase epsilon subunit
VSDDASDNPCCHSRVVYIVRGEPSAEELAALVAVLATLRGTAGAQPPAPRSAWADPAHRLRTLLHPRRLAQLGSGGYCVRSWLP